MKFERVLEIVDDDPVFDSGLLLAGKVDPADVQRQLSRWSAKGRLIQLRRGLYCLAAPYRKAKPHPFVIANRLKSGSYVSLESALAYHGLIPEHVPTVTSVTTGRPGELNNPLGRFLFQHVDRRLFSGYELVEVAGGQQAFVALPEKAVLDLVYLRAGGDELLFLEQLRFQALEKLDLERLNRMAASWQRPKMERAARRIARLASAEREEFARL